MSNGQTHILRQTGVRQLMSVWPTLGSATPASHFIPEIIWPPVCVRVWTRPSPLSCSGVIVCLQILALPESFGAQKRTALPDFVYVCWSRSFELQWRSSFLYIWPCPHILPNFTIHPATGICVHNIPNAFQHELPRGCGHIESMDHFRRGKGSTKINLIRLKKWPLIETDWPNLPIPHDHWWRNRWDRKDAQLRNKSKIAHDSFNLRPGVWTLFNRGPFQCENCLNQPIYGIFPILRVLTRIWADTNRSLSQMGSKMNLKSSNLRAAGKSFYF